jgi:hypothetical protein
MRVVFQPFRRHVKLKQILQADGWTLDAGRDNTVLAKHPSVADEAAARSRLHRLGLLTSGQLRIDFLPAATRRPVIPPRRDRPVVHCGDDALLVEK